MKAPLLSAGLLLLALPGLAQESPSFKLTEHAFNAGGHPAGGTVLTSPSFRVTLDALGDGVAGTSVGSASFRVDSGFVASHPPPGEVSGLLFTDKQTLGWDPERSVGVYHLYRDRISNLTGLGFGNCEQQDLPSETATDTDPVPTGDGYFYLVTAENRLEEEGTKGYQSDGPEREGAVCP